MSRVFSGPTGRAPRHLPFRRAAVLHERRAASGAVRTCARRGAGAGARPARTSGPRAGRPRLGMAGVFLSLRRVLPDRYPLALDVERYVDAEQRLGRALDYAVIVPRLQRL